MICVNGFVLSNVSDDKLHYTVPTWPMLPGLKIVEGLSMNVVEEARRTREGQELRDR